MKSSSAALFQRPPSRSHAHPLANSEGWILVFVFALTLAGILALTDSLRFAPVKDEIHFLQAALYLGQQFPPTLDQLRGYSEIQTPLAFIVWGQLGRLTGNVLLPGRLINLALVVAIVGLVAVRSGEASKRRLLSAVGLAVYPYLFPLGVHLYTDVPAAFLVLAGTCLHVRGRPRLAFALFALAIATRQYVVAIPAAIAAWEWTRSARKEARSWSEGTLALLGAATLLGWFAFFGGLAPQAGEEVWIPRYPAPMMHAGFFMLDYGLYFLAGLGVYFVVPELLLFRDRTRWRSLTLPKNAAAALGLLVLFSLYPPTFDSVHGGALVRALRLVLPNAIADDLRLVIFYGLALLAVVRFTEQLDLAFWIVVLNFVLMLKTQLPWEKYYLPVIAVLWFLKAEGRLEGLTHKTHDATRVGPPVARVLRGAPRPSGETAEARMPGA